MASVGRQEFKRLLDRGTTCVLVPGGVSECLYMERDKEVGAHSEKYLAALLPFCETGLLADSRAGRSAGWAPLLGVRMGTRPS